MSKKITICFYNIADGDEATTIMEMDIPSIPHYNEGEIIFLERTNNAPKIWGVVEIPFERYMVVSMTTHYSQHFIGDHHGAYTEANIMEHIKIDVTVKKV